MYEREDRDSEDILLHADQMDSSAQAETEELEPEGFDDDEGLDPVKLKEQLKASRRAEGHRSKEIARLRRESAATRAMLEELQNDRDERRKSEIKDAEAIAEMEYKRAFDEGDSEKVIKAQRDLDRIRETARQVKTRSQSQPQQREDDPETERLRSDFLGKHKWVTELEQRHFVPVKAYSDSLIQSGIGGDDPEHWEKLSKFLKVEFPDKFKSAQRPVVPGNRGSSSMPVGSKKQVPPDVIKAWEPYLPGDAKGREEKLKRLMDRYWETQRNMERE